MSTTGSLVPRYGRRLRAACFIFGLVAVYSEMPATPDDTPPSTRLEMMIPVCRFEVSSDERWVVILGFVSENGQFMKLGQRFLQPDDHPVGSAGIDGYWIDGAKLPAVRRLAPKGETRFRFGPGVVKWRGGQWVRVQPLK